MSISEERIKNAWDARLKWANETDDNRDLEEVILAADDIFMMGKHPPTPPPMTEPKLVAWMVFNGADYVHRTGGDKVKLENCSPAALHAMADHMVRCQQRWHQRTREQEAAVVTDETVELVRKRLCLGRIAGIQYLDDDTIRGAITAAFTAAKETK